MGTDQTFHLSVNLFTQNGQLNAHALQLGLSVEADNITDALRKLADEIDNQRGMGDRSGR